MTLYDFFENMKNSYRNNNELINEAFRTDLNIFCDKIGDNADYQPVYDHVKQNHKSWDKPPMMSMFYDAAITNKMMHEYHEKFRGWRECQICKTKYSFNSKQCPSCDSVLSIVIKWDSIDSYPSDVKIVQANCCQCKLYKPDKTGNGLRVYGCECKDYGKYYLKTADKICMDCVCRPCCVLAAREKFDDRYEDDLRHGRIEEGWIK